MFYFLFSLFILTFFLCLTTYILYPLIISILAQLRGTKPKKADITPFVSVIISAYNEQMDIAKKLSNTIGLNYPKDRIEILIGSDGSTDNTANIVDSYTSPSIRFFNYKLNRGKTSVQNDLVNESRGEILIFTDAASFLPKDSAKMLVRNFADKQVGCVAGRMSFIDTNSNLTTQSQGIYWKYEIKIREMESRLGSLIGVDGPLYAIRTENYIPLRENIISDLITPLLVLEQGKKVFLEPEALVEEQPTQKGEHEFNTRRRITLRGLVGIFSHTELINPLKHPWLSLQIFSHKILRWFVGPLAIINFLTCSVLLIYNITLINIIFVGYVFFFLSAYIGWKMEKIGKKNKLLAIPYYFFLVNIAATFGIVDFFRKKQATTWNTERSLN